MIRGLRVKDGQIVGQIHYKSIPIRPPDYLDVTLQFGAADPSPPQNLSPLSTDLAEQEVLSEFKRVMVSVPREPGCLIVHQIVCRRKNLILDQEIKFPVSGETEFDTIDVGHFDTHLDCLAFIEVKGIHAPRLLDCMLACHQAAAGRCAPARAGEQLAKDDGLLSEFVEIGCENGLPTHEAWLEVAEFIRQNVNEVWFLSRRGGQRRGEQSESDGT